MYVYIFTASGEERLTRARGTGWTILDSRTPRAQKSAWCTTLEVSLSLSK